MRIILACLVASVVFAAGCRAPQLGKFGNFAKAESVDLAQDAADILLANYPPAKTRLNLVQDADDAFGVALLERLRGSGYAVAEYVQPIRRDKYAENPVAPDGFDFGYVLDHVTGESGMRLTLVIGPERISRLYLVGGTPDEPRYSALGEWVRRQ